MSQLYIFPVVFYFIVNILLRADGYGTTPERPNIIVFLGDDMGYADLKSYGHPVQEFTAMDRMVTEGLMFSDFYVAESVCTPSRAAMLTGRLPARIGIFSEETASLRFFNSYSRGGLPAEEYTIPEMLSDADYATGMVGKWHLGINKYNRTDGTHLPTHHGFQWVGYNLPLSDDETCDEQGAPDLDECFLYDNTEIIQQPFVYANLTQKMTNQAIGFIKQQTKETPFFLYFAYIETHVALSRETNTSARGIYGDNVNLISSSVGQIIATLEELGIDNNTFVFFGNDNGGDARRCLYGGDNGLFKGGKAFVTEGGVRVPAIAWMPGWIQSGRRSTTMASLMDLLPTFAEMAGAPVPTNIDGRSLTDVIFGNSEQSGHTALFFYCGKFLHAMRYQNYKIYFRDTGTYSQDYLSCACPDGYQATLSTCTGGVTGQCDLELLDEPLVYNLQWDPREMYALNLTRLGDMMAEALDELALHESTFDLGAALIDDSSCDVIPCCDPENECRCNYDGVATKFAHLLC